jgi:hypothetical protein
MKKQVICGSFNGVLKVLNIDGLKNIISFPKPLLSALAFTAGGPCGKKVLFINLSLDGRAGQNTGYRPTASRQFLNQKINTMNEITLVLIAIAIFAIGYFGLNAILKPTSFYVRIIMAIALIALVWIFREPGKIPVTIIITAVAFSSLVHQIKGLTKFRQE